MLLCDQSLAKWLSFQDKESVGGEVVVKSLYSIFTFERPTNFQLEVSRLSKISLIHVLSSREILAAQWLRMKSKKS